MSFFIRHKAVIINALAIFLLFASGCSGKEDASRAASDTVAAKTEDYHADNDIAMTLKSIVDALALKEPLDTLEYDFEGVLTDGEGHPLYTDIQGSPGLWDVDVISKNSAVIRNIYLGDLLPEYLENYLTTSLNLTNDNIIETALFDDEEETEITVYRLDNCFIRFETRAAVAPNGLEGPLVRIMVSTVPPPES